MDILEEIDVFFSACQLTQDESNNLVFNGITGCFESKYLADWFVNQINFGWKLWRQAQAVPEGFALVSQKDLLELTIAINAVDMATHTESKTNEVREMWQDIALKLMALGEAQDLSHGL